MLIIRSLIFSVLIPSIPGREAMRAALIEKIQKQIDECGANVEILCLIDNRKRSVGEKRQALLDIARGEYVAFVDDDDDVLDGYVSRIVAASVTHPDVIVFDSFCTLDPDAPVLVTHVVGTDDQQYSTFGFSRGAWHIHAWRRGLVEDARFPAVNYAEDIAWLEHVRPLITTSIRIEAALYHYRFNREVTATQ